MWDAQGVAAIIGSLATLLLAWDTIRGNREQRRRQHPPTLNGAGGLIAGA